MLRTQDSRIAKDSRIIIANVNRELAVSDNLTEENKIKITIGIIHKYFMFNTTHGQSATLDLAKQIFLGVKLEFNSLAMQNLGSIKIEALRRQHRIILELTEKNGLGLEEKKFINSCLDSFNEGKDL
ncbi:MAG: hypothetical protein LBJ93_03625 [Clostridiales bacterium]|nr:hypothetical protein [Clostridiales bacterium]